MMKTIIFDMDGVLFDTEKIYDEAWRIILKEKKVENIDYVISGCRGLTSEGSAEFIDKNFDGKLSGKECLKDLIHKFNEIIEKRGVPEECIAVEDSINGATAAIRAGMNAIMVPDIVQPTKEIEKQLYRKFDSLLDVKDFLEKC